MFDTDREQMTRQWFPESYFAICPGLLNPHIKYIVFHNSIGTFLITDKWCNLIVLKINHAGTLFLQ